MADETRPPRHDRLPIKLIMPKQGTERRITGGGGPPKPFRTVDATYRTRLSNQVSALRNVVVPQSRRTGGAPVRVKLLSKAAAKSHRPEHLFSSESCPIIGSGRLGELFVKATPEGLDRLAHIIESNQSDRMTKELSCIEAIEPVTPVYRRGGVDAKEVLRRSPRGKQGFIARVRLFNFVGDGDQQKLVDDFESTCRKWDIRASRAAYSLSSFTYEIECRDVEAIETLSHVIGVRSIANMPIIRTVRPRMLNSKPLPKLPRRADVTGDFPVVVVVDSGISDQIPALESWVVGRDSQVAPQYQNTDHGTFVAGLICWGGELNPTVSGIDSSPCGLFDLQVIPNHDPAKWRYRRASGIGVAGIARSRTPGARQPVQGLEPFPRHRHRVFARRVFSPCRRTGQPSGKVSGFVRHQRRKFRYATATRLPPQAGADGHRKDHDKGVRHRND